MKQGRAGCHFVIEREGPMKRNIVILSLSAALLAPTSVIGQSAAVDPVVAPRDKVVYLTSEWQGERLPDGRPRVPDALLERLKNIKVEDAWQLLNGMGYRNQFEGGWRAIHEDRPIAGRALTAVYMPLRPNIQQRMLQEGHAVGHIGAMNSWPIDMLQNGDIYIADNFGKVAQGTLIGDKLGNSIFARTNTGVVFDGALRDVESLARIDGFNAFTRDWHPSFLEESMLMGINVPIRIGRITVLPGDAILAKRIGVVVIPAHLVEEVVTTAEIVTLRDEFVHERVRARVYTPGQVDARWTPEIEADFLGWLQQGRMHRLPVPYEEIQRYLQQRTW
jgi:4-hydroxy-4-methyl-2-oxoglutarate aldolase